MFVYLLLVCWFYELEMIFKRLSVFREISKQAKQSPLKKNPQVQQVSPHFRERVGA